MASNYIDSADGSREQPAGLPIDPVAAAKDYLRRGWSPVPVPRGEKAPRIRAWTQFVCDRSAVDITFRGRNVGVLLGARSGGLVDVDLDCPEAERLAAITLPATDAVFGRPSKPRSHYLYGADPIPKTQKFTAPDGSMLLEIRSTGALTLFPGSQHPSEEHVVWSEAGAASPIDSEVLQRRAALLAVASLIACHWPQPGSRENAALALAGGLHRAGVPAAEIPDVVEGIAALARDEEADSRRKAAEATVSKVKAGDAVTGWPTLAQIIDARVVDRCCMWLGVAPDSGCRSGSGGGDDEQGDGKRGKPRRSGGKISYAKLLVELARKHVVEFFRDGEQSFATYKVGAGGWQHCEHHALRSRPFRRFLRRLFYDNHNTVPGSQAVHDAVEQLDAHAQFDGREVSVFVRVAPHEENIYVDLCHPQWLAVRINSSGWKVVDDPPVKFVRKRGMTRLPLPVRGGSLQLLQPFLVVTGDDWVLVVGWLLMAYRPRGPYPILVVNGEQGACKSSIGRMSRLLVDPSRVLLRAEPKEPRDLAIGAENAWVLGFDNISSLPPWLSDGLCRIATGSGFGTREL